MHDVTVILDRLGNQADAARELLPLLYDELHTMAQRQFGQQQAGHTLQPTVLVHEAFLKLVGNSTTKYNDRKHFFAVAAMVMRQILVNHARDRSADKRGGGKKAGELNEDAIGTDDVEQQVDILDLNAALEKLKTIDARKHKIVELRFFGGLTVPEVAEVMELSVTTIENEWRACRAWLQATLG